MSDYELAKNYHEKGLQRFRGFIIEPVREAELMKNLPAEIKDRIESFSVMISLHGFYTFTSYNHLSKNSSFEEVRYHFILVKNQKIQENFTCTVDFCDGEVMNEKNLSLTLDDTEDYFIWCCNNKEEYE